MKTRKFSFPAFFLAFALGAVLSYGTVMCLAQSFDLPILERELLLSCLGFALLAAAFLSLRRNWMITALAAVLYAGVLVLYRQPLIAGLRTAVYRVTKLYAAAYAGISVLGAPDGDCTGVLTVLALPLAWISAWVVSREGSVLSVATLCAPWLCLCLMIVDIAPVSWLVLLAGIFLLLVVTNGVRARDPHDGAKLAWLLVLPVTALITALMLLSPPEDYVRSGWITEAQHYAETLLGKDEPVPAVPSPVRWNRQLRQVDLSLAGPRVKTHTKVLEYRSDTAITHLRGVSLGVYENNTWSAVEQDHFQVHGFDAAGLMTADASAEAQVTVRTVSRGNLLYTPYGMTNLPEGGAAVDDAYVANEDRLTDYTALYTPGAVSPDAISPDYQDYVNRNYTAVPLELQQALEALLTEAGIGLYGDPHQTADAVKAWLRSLAVYDLNTASVPAGEDFVLYFLRESKQGYCVHFATAAAMLLRTAHVPARYVTGYLVSGAPMEFSTVTTDDSHAWVEYYVNGTGWVLLDPTPADLTPEPDEPAAPEPEIQPQPDLPEPAPTPSEPTTPAPQTGSKPDPAAPHKSGPWLWLLLLPAMAAAVLVRRWITLMVRVRRCTRGHMNRRCLHLWRQLAQVSRITGDLPPEALMVLAEKAKFSQHTMTRAEWKQLAAGAKAATEALRRSASLPRRLWYRYGLVLD